MARCAIIDLDILRKTVNLRYMPVMFISLFYFLFIFILFIYLIDILRHIYSRLFHIFVREHSANSV